MVELCKRPYSPDGAINCQKIEYFKSLLDVSIYDWCIML